MPWVSPRRDDAMQRIARASVRPCAWGCLAVLVLALGAPRAFAADGAAVLSAKALALYNIARFVQWPSDSFEPPRNQLVVGILGEDDVAGELASTLSTKNVNGRPVYVRFVRRPEDARDCHILFVSKTDGARLEAVIQAAQTRGLLTVADADGFAARGGMVNFEVQGERVALVVNPLKAEQADLRFSAKLLSLARIVGDPRRGAGRATPQ